MSNNTPETTPASVHTPRLSIGLPVYNGANYLATALGSLLNQSFTDFELIISDNASTDRTAELCKTFAAADSRIRYFRQPDNLGAAANYNETLAKARGEYFKWAAHDDICKRDFLKHCVDVLDQQQEVVLCHSQSEAIDDRGRVIGLYDSESDATQPDPAARFARMIMTRHYCIPVFGVIRRAVLVNTIRHGDWVGADRNLLSELALIGKIHLVDQTLFQRRHHQESSISKFKDERERASWFRQQTAPADSVEKMNKIYPTWRRLKEYLKAVRRVDLTVGDRLRCRFQLIKWLFARHHTGPRNASLLLREWR